MPRRQLPTATRLFHALFLACVGIGATAITCPTARAADAAGFAFKDAAGEHLDILLDGIPVARYMYAHDDSTPKRHEETYKPYLHIFDAEGKATITKGPYGQDTHHRGIFIGWNKIGFDGKQYNLWEMKDGELIHRKFLKQEADADHATMTALIDWVTKSGQTPIVETRTMTIRRGPAPARLMVDFDTTLEAPNGDVTLDGNAEHAGVHYRPANELDRKQTVYLLPRENANAHQDVDYPWAGETYSLKGHRYSIVEMNHPSDPKKTHFSAYRDYGRFGVFFKAKIRQGDSLKLKYRFLVADGEMPPIAVIQKCWDEFAGVSEPSPLPKTTTQSGGPIK